MAQSDARSVDTARQGAALAERVVDLYKDIYDFLEFNSDQAIDWNGNPVPAYIPVDADGNIDGRQFPPTAMGNVVGTFAQIRNLLTNQTVTEGDHLGNLNVVSVPE
jgi:hypothetical protein